MESREKAHPLRNKKETRRPHPRTPKRKDAPVPESKVISLEASSLSATNIVRPKALLIFISNKNSRQAAHGACKAFTKCSPTPKFVERHLIADRDQADDHRAHLAQNRSQNQAFEGGCFNHLSRLLGSPDPRLFGALLLGHARIALPVGAPRQFRTNLFVEKSDK
jgi:hypothetical protein